MNEVDAFLSLPYLQSDHSNEVMAFEENSWELFLFDAPHSQNFPNTIEYSWDIFIWAHATSEYVNG